MFSLHQICGVASSAVGIASFLVYIRGIYRNKEKPHIFSWFLWSLLTFIIWYAQFLKGAGPGAWITLTSAVFCGIIAVLAWHRGEKNITHSDWAALIVGLGSIPLWYVTREPLPAVALLCCIDFVSIYPTIRKSMINPWEENVAFYGINILKWIIGLFAIEQMLIVNWLYPASLLVQNAIIFFMIYSKRRKGINA